jgi:hypothetical protein
LTENIGFAGRQSRCPAGPGFLLQEATMLQKLPAFAGVRALSSSS